MISIVMALVTLGICFYILYRSRQINEVTVRTSRHLVCTCGHAINAHADDDDAKCIIKDYPCQFFCSMTTPKPS